MNTEHLYTTGKIAETNAEDFCKKYWLPYKKGNDYSQKCGVDFSYNDGKKWTTVDVKNTFDVFLFNVKKDNKKLYVRHPFKANTRTEEFWVQDKFKNDWAYMGPVKSYMIGKYFANELNYKLFVAALQGWEKIVVSSPAIQLKEIKEQLKRFVKDDVYINYIETQHQFTMRMVTYKDKNYIKKHAGSY